METVKFGETALLEEPYCHVLIQKFRSIYCDYCFAKCDALQKCSGCNSMWYCNAICQKKDWIIHKRECKCLRNYLPKVPLEFVRFMLRLIITESLDLPTDPTCPRTFEDLMTHAEEIKNDIERTEQFAKILYCLKETAGNVVRLPPTSVVFDIFCRLIINAYSIFDWEMMDLGIGIYLRGSMYNHSCKPNVVTMFDGIKLVFRAVEDIKDASVQTVFINYFEQPFVPREMLMKEYYFDCTCNRCLDETLMDTVHGFCCVNPMCDGAVGLGEDNTFKSCTKCHLKDFPAAYQERALKILQDCKSLQNQVYELKGNGGWPTSSCIPAETSETRLSVSKEVLNRCQLILEDIKTVLHPMNVFRVSTVHRAMDAAINTEQWQLALNFALTTLAPYRSYYSLYNPNYAAVLFKIGKLQVILEYYKDALAHLQQAANILPITHGRDHEILKETRLLIARCKNEFGIQQEFS